MTGPRRAKRSAWTWLVLRLWPERPGHRDVLYDYGRQWMTGTEKTLAFIASCVASCVGGGLLGALLRRLFID